MCWTRGDFSSFYIPLLQLRIVDNVFPELTEHKILHRTAVFRCSGTCRIIQKSYTAENDKIPFVKTCNVLKLLNNSSFLNYWTDCTQTLSNWWTSLHPLQSNSIQLGCSYGIPPEGGTVILMSSNAWSSGRTGLMILCYPVSWAYIYRHITGIFVLIVRHKTTRCSHNQVFLVH